jgi:hypothetical protein
MEPRRRNSIPSPSASRSLWPTLRGWIWGGGVSGRLRRTGRTAPAQPTEPVEPRSLWFAITDLSLASVLPFATRRTRSGTAFGNVGKRDSIITASGDDGEVLLLLGIVNDWMAIRLRRLPALGGRVVGGRAGRRHRGSGTRMMMGRRAEQHRGRELTGQLTTDLLWPGQDVFAFVPAAPGAAALLRHAPSRAVRLRTCPKNRE